MRFPRSWTTWSLLATILLCCGLFLPGCLGRISPEDLAQARRAAETAQQRVEVLDQTIEQMQDALAEAKAAAAETAEAVATAAPDVRPQAEEAAARAAAVVDSLSGRLGDLQALVPVARDLSARMTQSLREAEAVSRDGGDGLDVIIAGISTVLGLGMVGERILALRKQWRTNRTLAQTVAAIDATEADDPEAAAAVKARLAVSHDEASRVEIRRARLHPSAAEAKAAARRAAPPVAPGADGAVPLNPPAPPTPTA